jgi:uncharacterized protein GlcG (DUF336 family)
MYQKIELGLNEAQAAINAILTDAMRNVERPIAISVADRNGKMIAFARMDRCAPLPQKIAIAKAYTSAIMGDDTGAVAERMQQANRKNFDLGDAKLIFLQGGVVIRHSNGVILGGIGVSGLAADEDEELARVGLNSIQILLT